VKKTILILLLLVSMVVGGSYQVGKVIEAELPNILTRIGELGQMQISISSYERNIFRSTVRTEIVLASLSGSREQIFLRHEIWHGPLPFGRTTDGEWQLKPMSALMETVVDRNNPPSGLIGELFALCPELYDSIELTRFDFAGNGTSSYQIPAFEKSFGSGNDAFSVKWDGMSGTARIDKSLQSIKGEMIAPGAKVMTSDGYFIFDATRSDYRIFEDFGGLLLGNVTVDIKSIDIGTHSDQTVLSDLQFRNEATLNDEVVSYSIAIGIESLQSGARTYGPAGFEVDFTGLDATAILDVQKKLQSIQSRVKTLTEEEIARSVFAIYAEALPALMEKTPEIKLNYFNLTGPNGELWCKGNIRFENRLKRPIRDFNAFLSTLRAEGESQIGKPLMQSLLTGFISGQLAEARSAGQLGDISDDQFQAMAASAAAEQMAQLEANGMIVPVKDKYRVEFTYANRQAHLNGQPLQ
jgi:uncharacterized protein YdgA (DUF945 family)